MIGLGVCVIVAVSTVVTIGRRIETTITALIDAGIEPVRYDGMTQDVRGISSDRREPRARHLVDRRPGRKHHLGAAQFTE